MNLSPHFTLSEMTTTNSGLPNIPSGIQLQSLILLCNNVLEEVRGEFGPVSVTSGFRSPEVNKHVGGAADSQHLFGEAADIHCPGIPNAKLWQWIVDALDFDQVIAERVKESDGAAGWVHVSYKKQGNRHSYLSAPFAGRYILGLHYAD